jgi:hypothetical protein
VATKEFVKIEIFTYLKSFIETEGQREITKAMVIQE